MICFKTARLDTPISAPICSADMNASALTSASILSSGFSELFGERRLPIAQSDAIHETPGQSHGCGQTVFL